MAMTSNEILRSGEPINKLAENQVYIFLKYQMVKTRYGTNYVLIDHEDNKYWSVSKINNFIKVTNPDLIEVITYNYDTFTNEKGKVIRCLDLRCKAYKLTETSD